jgi:isovaleryl-CoA dehydrogenase
MQAAFDYAVEYVHDRKQFGRPVGTFQLMQGKSLSNQCPPAQIMERPAKIAGKFYKKYVMSSNQFKDMYTKLNSSRAYVYAVARACDKGEISRRVCLVSFTT